MFDTRYTTSVKYWNLYIEICLKLVCTSIKQDEYKTYRHRPKHRLQFEFRKVQKWIYTWKFLHINIYLITIFLFQKYFSVVYKNDDKPVYIHAIEHSKTLKVVSPSEVSQLKSWIKPI